MKRLALALALFTAAPAFAADAAPIWVESQHRYVADTGPVCACVRYPDADACDPGNPHPHEPHKVRKPRAARTARRRIVVTFGYCVAYYQAAGFDWDFALIACTALRR